MSEKKFKTLKETTHPLQPIYLDDDGVVRFKPNTIVDYLVSGGAKENITLNDLADMGFPREDWEQLAQLIGYSVSGWGDLSYVSANRRNAADAMVENPKDDPQTARIQELESTLNSLRSKLKEPIAELYGVHPDDLQEDIVL